MTRKEIEDWRYPPGRRRRDWRAKWLKEIAYQLAVMNERSTAIDEKVTTVEQGDQCGQMGSIGLPAGVYGFCVRIAGHQGQHRFEVQGT